MKNNKNTLEPISGFPEFSPEEQIIFNNCLRIIRDTYERFGFVPIETPSVERVDTLTSKGGDEKEIYGLHRLSAEDADEYDANLALHFDLTVPLARYVAQRYGQLTFPFRRYQLQKVWRGERSQSGRYKEFMQCDIDVIGNDTLSLAHDAEIPSIIYEAFSKLNIGKFVIRINNRKILQGFFEHIGLEGNDKVVALRAVDKLEKNGRNSVKKELTQIGLSNNKAFSLIDFVETDLETDDLLKKISSVNYGKLFATGVQELSTVIAGIRALSVPEDFFKVDLSIARGLDYYTGTIYETVLTDHPGIGSICSGGRYENLSQHFSDKKLPGVGISIGLTRLVPRLLSAGVLTAEKKTVAPVLITTMQQESLTEYLHMATSLRDAGINTEVYLEPKNFKKQMKYANRKGFSLVVIAGENEFLQGVIRIKNLETGEQIDIPESELVTSVQQYLHQR
ncbi:MAG: histidine--tRNA ligase [Candidatus Peregrinibacteria bacterium]|nr:histidine--tRNA ligase [Candidatus Peregrinibacteria bacterium]